MAFLAICSNAWGPNTNELDIRGPDERRPFGKHSQPLHFHKLAVKQTEYLQRKTERSLNRHSFNTNQYASRFLDPLQAFEQNNIDHGAFPGLQTLFCSDYTIQNSRLCGTNHLHDSHFVCSCVGKLSEERINTSDLLC